MEEKEEELKNYADFQKEHIEYYRKSKELQARLDNRPSYMTMFEKAEIEVKLRLEAKQRELEAREANQQNQDKPK